MLGLWCPRFGRRWRYVRRMSTSSRCSGRGGACSWSWLWSWSWSSFCLVMVLSWSSFCLVMVLVELSRGQDKDLHRRLMEDRKPFELRGLIIAYNLFQTLLSFWGFTQGWKFYVTGDYRWGQCARLWSGSRNSLSLTCQPVDYSDNPEAKRALMMAWVFYASKILDM